MVTWLAEALEKTHISDIFFSTLCAVSACEGPPPQAMGVLGSGDCGYTRAGSWHLCPPPQTLTKGVLVVGGSRCFPPPDVPEFIPQTSLLSGEARPQPGEAVFFSPSPGSSPSPSPGCRWLGSLASLPLYTGICACERSIRRMPGPLISTAGPNSRLMRRNRNNRSVFSSSLFMGPINSKEGSTIGEWF